MMPGRRCPGFQSRGSVTSTQYFVPSRGRVTWKRRNCAPLTSGPTSTFFVSCFASVLLAVRSHASVIVVRFSRVTMNCCRSRSSGATNSSYTSAGESMSRVRTFVVMSMRSSHGRGACLYQLAPGARVPVSATCLPSVPSTTYVALPTLRLTRVPAVLSLLLRPPPKPAPPNAVMVTGKDTLRPRFQRSVGLFTRTAITAPLSLTNMVLLSRLKSTVPSCGPPRYSTVVSFGPYGAFHTTTCPRGARTCTGAAPARALGPPSAPLRPFAGGVAGAAGAGTFCT